MHPHVGTASAAFIGILSDAQQVVVPLQAAAPSL
jgi:hypothetical protein